MKTRHLFFAGILLWLVAATAFAQSDEWERLNNEALSHTGQGRYTEALSLAQQALKVAESLGTEHPKTVTSLYAIGFLYRQIGLLDKAESFLQRTLSIQENTLGSMHTDVAFTLSEIAMLYEDKHNYVEAIHYFQRSLLIREKISEIVSSDGAIILKRLSKLYSLQGQYVKAESFLQRALLIQKKVLGADHPDVVKTTNDLAMIYITLGEFSKGEALLQHLLSIPGKEKEFESELSGALLNLARLYFYEGRLIKAESILQILLSIQKKTFGSEHPKVADIFSMLGLCYLREGQYKKAQSFMERAQAIYEKSPGPEYSDVERDINRFANLGNLGNLYRIQSQYAKAESLLQRTLDNLEKFLDPEHPLVAANLNNLAVLYQKQGKYDKAQPLNERALAIFEKSLGPEHPDAALSLQNAALNLWAQGGAENMSHALELHERANTIYEHHLKLMMAKGSEQDKRDYMATIRRDPDAMISFHQALPDNTQAARLALTTVLQHKGRLLDAVTQSVMALRQRMNSEDQALLDQWSDINDERANLFNLIRYGKIDHDAYLKRKQELETQADTLEAKISARSTEFTAKIQPITLAAVQQAIPQDTVLVEYLRYQPYNPKEDQYAPAHYIAYLLRATGDPVAVELGDAALIDPLVEQFRKALANSGDGTINEIARKLDAAILQPVRSHLGDTRKILVSPDGALNLIPFAALQDEQNRYLVKNYHFTYVSSGRDLLRLDVLVDNKQPPVIFADVDYGTTNIENKPAIIKKTTHCASNGEYACLPGTETEGKEIQAILTAAKLWVGQNASKSKLLQLDSPQILHLATHGFFLGDIEESALGRRSRVIWEEGIMQSGNAKPKNQFTTENPLLRSGLALANANQSKVGDDEGLLTALEVTNLNLWGTRLVVLSACETGIGEIRNGQGVFGLRRALVIAGSETQVMSLWKVDDDGTKALMVDYYQRLLNKEGRSEAMRQTQLAMLASKNYNHPFYWASFIVSGDWKPMERNNLIVKKS